MLSIAIRVTRARTLHVTSAVQGRDPHSECNLYKTAGLLTVCHFYHGHANGKPSIKAILHHLKKQRVILALTEFL